MLQKADIVCHAIGTLSNRGQNVQNPAVSLAGIGLSADEKAFFKAELRRNSAIHLINFLLIPVKKVHKAGLCAGGATAAQETHGGKHMVQLLQVGEKILHPERSAFSHCYRLRGLIMRVAESGRVRVLLGERGQIHQHGQNLSPQILQAVPIENQIGVIRYIAAGSAKVNDAGSGGRSLSVGVDMSHDIMADLFFSLLRHGVINIADVCLQLRDLLCGNRQTELMLRSGQSYPQLPPCLKTHIRRKQMQHILGGVPGG